jgi:very-short-patch-repair endonuclease
MRAEINPPRNGEVAARRADGGGSRSLRRPEVYAARKLRQDMSLPEVCLWEHLRGQKLGMKFRRQHPIGPFKADFCCLDARLVVEVDGEAHSRGDNPRCDEARDAYFEEKGFAVIRIPARDVLGNMEGVLTLLRLKAENPLRQPGGLPPPRAGEDFS